MYEDHRPERELWRAEITTAELKAKIQTKLAFHQAKMEKWNEDLMKAIANQQEEEAANPFANTTRMAGDQIAAPRAARDRHRANIESLTHYAELIARLESRGIDSLAVGYSDLEFFHTPDEVS